MIYDVIDDVLPENVNSYITSVIHVPIRDGIQQYQKQKMQEVMAMVACCLHIQMNLMIQF